MLDADLRETLARLDSDPERTTKHYFESPMVEVKAWGHGGVVPGGGCRAFYGRGEGRDCAAQSAGAAGVLFMMPQGYGAPPQPMAGAASLPYTSYSR